MADPSRMLGMLAKYWHPGACKTRLALDIGKVAAAQFQETCVRTLARRFDSFAEGRILFYDPPESLLAFEAVVQGRWRLEAQASGDLGARMAACFDLAFGEGAKSVVLIGSDSPDLPRDFINQAFESLTHRSVVLGPAPDGGYYLVGAAGSTPPIFRGIEWSTPRVWRQTIDSLLAAGLDYTELPPWRDVDDWNDLTALRRSLDQPDRRSPELAALREHVSGLVFARK